MQVPGPSMNFWKILCSSPSYTDRGSEHYSKTRSSSQTELHRTMAERVTLRMSGGGPWGFRLLGGEGDPLTIAKLRKKSKAHDSGMCEGDVLLGINGYSCQRISHSVAMGLVDASPDLTMLVFRGCSSDRNAINTAFQQLGGELQSVPASATSQETSQNAAKAAFSSSAPAPVPYTPPQQDMAQRTVNGYAAPQSFTQRREQHFEEGDSQRHVTTETTTQKFGGTTLTKVTRQEETSSFGGVSPFQPAPQKPASMFNVSNVSGSASKPGVWAPSGGGAPLQQQRPFNVSGSGGISLTQNPDQSVTMSIGLSGDFDDSAGKENIAPFGQSAAPSKPVPQFNVKRITKTHIEQSWQPSTGPVQTQTQTHTIVAKHAPFSEPEPEPEPARMREIPHPIDLSKLMMEGSGSDDCSTPDKKKKMFADSAFYDDPDHRYPTIEEQVKMARKVALSLEAPANKKARGHSMFIKRKMKADRWTTVEPGVFLDQNQVDVENILDGAAEKYYMPEPWKQGSHTWQPTLQPSGNRAGMGGWDANRIPSPPPLPSLFRAPVLPIGKDKDKDKVNALSAEEFEKLRLYDQKSTHTNVNPAMCFSLAQDLKNMKGKGGKLFAKRKAKSEKWVVEAEPSAETTPNKDFMEKILLSVPVEQQDQRKPAPSVNKNTMDYLDGGGPVVNRLKDMIDPPKPKMTPWDAAVESGGVSVDKAFDHLRGYNPYAKSGTDLASKLGQAASRTEELGPVPSQLGAPSESKFADYNTKVKGWSPAGGSSVPAAPSAFTPVSVAAAPNPGYSGGSSVPFTPGHGKMRPWYETGDAPRASHDSPASGAAYNPVTPPGSQPAGGFKPVSFKAPGSKDTGVFQPKWMPGGSDSGASSAPGSTASPMMQPSPVPSYHSTGSVQREITEADGYCDL